IIVFSLIINMMIMPIQTEYASAGSQSWYITDNIAGLPPGANYKMIRVTGNGTSDYTIVKSTSKIIVANESSQFVCRMSGTWTVVLKGWGSGGTAAVTVFVGILSGGTFTSYGTAASQNFGGPGATKTYSVTTTSHNISPDSYLAIKITVSSAKDFLLDQIINFTVTSYDPSGINFGSLTPGLSNQPANQSAGQGAVTLTIGSDTNVPVNIQLRATDFSGVATLLLSSANVQYDDDNTLGQGGGETGLAQVTLTTSYATWYPVSERTASVVQCYHWITIPGAQTPGEYVSTFYYQAVRQ
ncbi:MAG: hypothetical protein NTV30_11255, partial [Chloroflexi bacterium]|nr:hypothetical protein [Chloroflexota bacterium]